jgi:hypothetical protein
MVKVDKALPYPYITGYTGTYEDRRKAVKNRLPRLISDLELIRERLAQGNYDINLLADLEACHEIAREMLDIVDI